jgi:hypothetical protein
MKSIVNRFKKLTLLSAAAYIFIMALAAKGIFLYGSQHPSKKDLIPVNGIVKKIKLGGQGNSTYFKIESDRGTHRYSSYYGKVWPGMERIHLEDRVEMLAERNKLSRGELLTGKQYYIWGLIHENQAIVLYEDVRNLVNGEEQTINQYANVILACSTILLLIASFRKIVQK